MGQTHRSARQCCSHLAQRAEERCLAVASIKGASRQCLVQVRRCSRLLLLLLLLHLQLSLRRMRCSTVSCQTPLPVAHAPAHCHSRPSFTRGKILALLK